MDMNTYRSVFPCMVVRALSRCLKYKELIHAILSHILIAVFLGRISLSLNLMLK